MRYFIALLYSTFLFASSYSFDEYKFISAVGTSFKQSGNITFKANKTIITYKEPKYKKIINDGVNITIEGKSAKKYKLKGKALFYTKLFIDIMSRLGNIKEIKTNRDFDVKKVKDIYELSFHGEIEMQILKAEVKIENSKVISFKLFLKNNDTLEIVKR